MGKERVMSRKTNGLIFFSINILLIIAGGMMLQRMAAAEQTAVATDTVGGGFTYQGYLENNGTPVTDSCDLRFTLYDAADEGEQIGATLPKTNVAVTNGYFTISELDFGTDALSGG
jgi:hypothetical protein